MDEQPPPTRKKSASAAQPSAAPRASGSSGATASTSTTSTLAPPTAAGPSTAAQMGQVKKPEIRRRRRPRTSKADTAADLLDAADQDDAAFTLEDFPAPTSARTSLSDAIQVSKLEISPATVARSRILRVLQSEVVGTVETEEAAVGGSRAARELGGDESSSDGDSSEDEGNRAVAGRSQSGKAPLLTSTPPGAAIASSAGSRLAPISTTLTAASTGPPPYAGPAAGAGTSSAAAAAASVVIGGSASSASSAVIAHHPLFGPHARAICSISSVRDLDQRFAAARDDWKSWHAPFASSKSKYQYCRVPDAIYNQTDGIATSPPKIIYPLIRFTSKFVQDDTSSKPIAMQKKALQPDWLAGYNSLFSPFRRETARLMTVILSRVHDFDEYAAIMESNLCRYFQDPGETEPASMMEKELDQVLAQYHSRRGRKRPLGTDMISKIVILLLIAHTKDGNATMAPDGVPQIGDPNGSGIDDHRKFAYDYLFLAALEIGIQLLKTDVSAEECHYAHRNLNDQAVVTVSKDQNNKWTLLLGVENYKGSVAVQKVHLYLPDKVANPPPLSSPPLARLKSYRPDVPDSVAQTMVSTLQWLNVTLEEDGTTALPEGPDPKFWTNIRTKFFKQPLGLTRVRQNVAFCGLGAARDEWAILRLSRALGGGSERAIGLGAVADQALAQEAVERGNTLMESGATRASAERAMAAFLDVEEETLTKEQSDERLAWKILPPDSAELQCAGCLKVKNAADFPIPGVDMVEINRILCRRCDLGADPDGFAPRFAIFKTFRKDRADEGEDRIGSTPRSLAMSFNGHHGYDFDTGYAMDGFSGQKIPLSTSDGFAGISSIDCVAPVPLDSDSKSAPVKHLDFRNTIPTLATRNFAMQQRSRHHGEIAAAFGGLVPVVKYILRLQNLDKDDPLMISLQALQKLLLKLREFYIDLSETEWAFPLFRPMKEGTTKTTGNFLDKTDPQADFLGILRFMDARCSSLHLRESPDRTLPGSYKFYRSWDEFKNLDISSIKKYEKKAADRAEGGRYRYTPFAEKRPDFALDPAEQARTDKLISAIEADKTRFPNFEGFPRLADGSPAPIPDKERHLWEASKGRKLLKSDIAAEACFRTKRMVKFCDKRYRKCLDADSLDGLVGNMLVELYIEYALGEDDLFLGDTYLLAENHPAGAGIGHIRQKEPMKLGPKVDRPQTLDEYDFALRNVTRRVYKFTRQYTVQLQLLDSDEQRVLSLDLDRAYLLEMLDQERFVQLTRAEHATIAETIRKVAARPDFSPLLPWKERGFLA